MKLITSLVIVVALAAVGCGGGSNETTSSHDLAALRAVCDVVYEDVNAESLPPDAKSTILAYCNDSGSDVARRAVICKDEPELCEGSSGEAREADGTSLSPKEISPPTQQQVRQAKEIYLEVSKAYEEEPNAETRALYRKVRFWTEALMLWHRDPQAAIEVCERSRAEARAAKGAEGVGIWTSICESNNYGF